MKKRLEDILSSKLRDYEIRPEAADWTAIERGLGLDGPKRVPLTRYISIAAAMAIAVALGVLVTFTDPVQPFDNPIITVQDPERHEPAVQSVTDSPGAQESTALAAVVKLKNILAHHEQHRSSIPEANKYAIALAEGINEYSQTPDTNTLGPDATRRSRIDSYTRSASQQRTPYDYFDERDMAGRTRRLIAANTGWSVSLFADGRTGFSSVSTSPLPYNLSASAALTEFDLTDGIRLNTTQAEWDHAIPLSFGFTVRKNLTDKWGVETGLVYTYLSARSKLDSENTLYRYKSKQELHYLGIPLAITYSPLKTKNFEFYLRGGGKMDFNIGTKVSDTVFTRDGNSSTDVTRYTVSGIQWSVSANVGAMYKISPVFGVYFEPGVSYYFKNNSHPESYWTQNPTNFTLSLGIRANF